MVTRVVYYVRISSFRFLFLLCSKESQDRRGAEEDNQKYRRLRMALPLPSLLDECASSLLSHAPPSTSSSAATPTTRQHEYCASRADRLNAIRVFGTNESAIGIGFMEPQTPLLERSPRRTCRFAAAEGDDDAAEQLQRLREMEGEQLSWVRSIGFSGRPQGQAYPPRFAAAETIVDDIPTMPTTNFEYRFLLHQEATYRRSVILQQDVEMCFLFDAFYDGLERLRVEVQEHVGRYWALSDCESAWNSLGAHRIEDAHAMELRGALTELQRAEDTRREELYDEFLCGVDAFEAAEAAGYLRACRKATSSSQLPHPPSSSEASRPRKSDASEATRRLQPQLPQEHQQHHRHAQQRRILEQFLLGQKLDALSPAKPNLVAGDSSPVKISGTAAAHSALIMDFSTPVEVRLFVLEQETRGRSSIDESYKQETAVLRRRLAEYASLVQVGLAQFRVEMEEEADRSNVIVAYFFMMLEGCETLETLRRREIIISKQPRQHAEFKYEERQAWLRARKTESDRFTREELDAVEQDRQLRDALTRWSESRLKERLGMNRAETNARVALMHDESSQHGIIQEMFEDGMSSVREVQAAFVIDAERRATTVVWDQRSYEAVYLREAQHRMSLIVDEREAFQLLRAAETSCYLATRRAWLINAAVADELAPYDAFQRQLDEQLELRRQQQHELLSVANTRASSRLPM